MTPTAETQRLRAFVDALRGCLGLAPLYAADAGPTRANSVPMSIFLGGDAKGGRRIPVTHGRNSHRDMVKW